MPVYTNTSEIARPFPGCLGAFAVDATVEIPRYAWPIPDGWELTSEEGNASPCVTLHNGAIAATQRTGLAAYDQITIANGTNNTLNVHMNGDTTNTGGDNLIVLIAGETRVLDNRKGPDSYSEYGSLSLSGSGTGSVVITGYVNYAGGKVQ